MFQMAKHRNTGVPVWNVPCVAADHPLSRRALACIASVASRVGGAMPLHRHASLLVCSDDFLLGAAR
jgi:hypothetical protein